MSKFRAKPVEIEAVQFLPHAVTPVPDWFKAELQTGRIWYQGGGSPLLTLNTANGIVEAQPGDWIIREPSGVGAYPCKPDVFAAKYEPVDAPAPAG
jgi:hypothetical protein